MKSDIIKLIILAIIIAAAFTTIQRFFFPYEKIVTKTETVTRVDTTKIDSLFSIIDSLESIPPVERDTVFITKYVNLTDTIEEDQRKLEVTFSDTMIVATTHLWMNLITGEVNNSSFEYILKQRLLRREETLVVKHINTNTVTTTTTTKTVRPNSYFSIGALGSTDTIVPAISYTTSNRSTILYGYNVDTNSHQIGFMIPIF